MEDASAPVADADVPVSSVPSADAKPDTSNAPASLPTATQEKPPAASAPNSSMQQVHVASTHSGAGRDVQPQISGAGGQGTSAPGKPSSGGRTAGLGVAPQGVFDSDSEHST